MLRLRPYKKEDAKEILSWTKDEYAFYQWSAGVLGEYPLTEEQFHVVQKNRAFTLMEEDTLVGFFILRNPGIDLNALRMGFVIVNPKCRNKGLGKQMVQLGLQYAFELYGANKVSLGVFTNNPSAYHCYKSVGFQETETKETYSVLNETWDCIEMEFQKEQQCLRQLY